MEEFEHWNSQLINFYRNGDWERILELEYQVPPKIMDDLRRSYLWAWPQLGDLTFISDMAKKHGLTKGYLSIGCGSGLLEWLIQTITGIQITGLEIDKGWWSCKHSPLSFIPLKFIPRSGDIPSLNTIMGIEENTKIEQKEHQELMHYDEIPENGAFGLIFCYFNNGKVFNKYVKYFEGNMIVIIGPVEGRHVYTEPLPLKPDFENAECWSLCSQKLTENRNNVIAVYCRNL